MTQVSATPVSTPAQTPGESGPPVLAQAGQRAEFSARLLAALAALRGAVPAPAPTAAEAPAAPLDDAAAPLEEAEAIEEGAPGEEDASATSALAPELVPLVLLQLSSDDPSEDPSGGEGAPAAENPQELSAESAPDAALPRSAEFAPLAGLGQSGADDPTASESALDAAALGADATQSAEPARRAEKNAIEAPSPAPDAAPDTALTRGSELAAAPPQTARSESAPAASGRVLPELPVRNEQEIVDNVRFLLNRKGGQASIELHPPQLGQVGLRISVTDHAVRLEITADRLQVAELLHKHLPQLQQALEAQGLQIDRAQVDLRERGGDGRERGGDPDQGDARRGRDFDGDGAQRQSSQARSALPAYSLGAVDVHA